MSFPKQEKLNASERMKTLFHAINNEISSSLEYTGSMRKGNRDNINYEQGEFDIDADIILNININDYSAQIIFEQIHKIIKRSIRHHEHIKLKSVTGSNTLIIHIWSDNARYTFDVAIKTSNGHKINMNNNGTPYWE